MKLSFEATLFKLDKNYSIEKEKKVKNFNILMNMRHYGKSNDIGLLV